MRVPKLAGGPDRGISLLGVAAPLSSRKTGYLLRVAHMMPIIFFDILGLGPLLGPLLNGFAFPTVIIKAWEHLYLNNKKQRTNKKQMKMKGKELKENCQYKDTFYFTLRE